MEDTKRTKKNKGFGNNISTDNSNKKKDIKSKDKKQDANIFEKKIKPLIIAGRQEDAKPVLRLLAQSETNIAEVYEELYLLCIEARKEKESNHWHNKWLAHTSQNKLGIKRQVQEAKKIKSEELQLLFIKKALKMEPSNQEMKANLIDLYLQKEDWSKAKRIIESLRKEDKSNPDWLWRAAWIEIENGKKDRAKKLFDQLKLSMKRYKTKYTYRSNQIQLSLEIATSTSRTKDNNEKIDRLYREMQKENWPENRIFSYWLMNQPGRAGEAKELLLKAFEQQPHSKSILENIAKTHLILEEWVQGFKALKLLEERNAYLQNDNELSIISHGSMGDGLLWSRWINLHENNNQISINLFVQYPLVSFLQRNLKGKAKVYAHGSSTPKNKNQIKLISLPGIKEYDFKSLERLPKWKADEQLQIEWYKRLELPSDRPIIALNWHGPALKFTQEEEITDIPLNAMIPKNLPSKISLLGIQKGFGSEELDQCVFREKFIEKQSELKRINTLEQIAAVLSLCDWLICDDSGPAHLASCLGINTVVCLPEYSDWRWPRGSDTPPWYPKTTVIRKNHSDDWNDCLSKAWEKVDLWMLSKQEKQTS